MSRGLGDLSPRSYAEFVKCRRISSRQRCCRAVRDSDLFRDSDFVNSSLTSHTLPPCIHHIPMWRITLGKARGPRTKTPDFAAGHSARGNCQFCAHGDCKLRLVSVSSHCGLWETLVAWRVAGFGPRPATHPTKDMQPGSSVCRESWRA